MDAKTPKRPKEEGPPTASKVPNQVTKSDEGTATRLSDTERARLAECEQIICDRTLPFYEWGRALATIKKRRLFREAHRTFDEYCREVEDGPDPRLSAYPSGRNCL